MTDSNLYRHGDVLVQRVDVLPTDTDPMRGLVLAHGELTGHSHRIRETDGRAKLVRRGADLYLVIAAEPATLVHDEHGPISLAPGAYRVWRQREYVPSNDPEAPVRFVPVRD